jgi:hypothetical protein
MRPGRKTSERRCHMVMRDVLFRHLPPWEQQAVKAPVGENLEMTVLRKVSIWAALWERAPITKIFREVQRANRRLNSPLLRPISGGHPESGETDG